MAKVKKAKVQEAPIMAPNDPRRVPIAHRKLVNNLFSILKKHGYNIFEAQVITQALSVLSRTSDLNKGMDALTDFVEAVTSVEDGQRDIEAILQILGMKMTESLNQLKLDNMDFQELLVD